jgi:hypothetical protein
MYAASVTSIRKTLGAAAIGITLLGTTGVSSAFAQERMASTDSDRASYSKCDAIKDHAEAAGCYTREDILRSQKNAAEARARGAAAEKRAAEANTEITCQDTLMEGIKSGRFKKPDVRAAYGGQPVGSVSSCVILNKLTRS